MLLPVNNSEVVVLSVLPHPDGSLSTVRLLQAEDLRHHVVGGGMQQDPARGQANHHIAAHRRQANRDGIWTCSRKKQHFPYRNLTGSIYTTKL